MNGFVSVVWTLCHGVSCCVNNNNWKVVFGAGTTLTIVTSKSCWRPDETLSQFELIGQFVSENIKINDDFQLSRWDKSAESLCAVKWLFFGEAFSLDFVS